jgi:hypothetical protein
VTRRGLAAIALASLVATNLAIAAAPSTQARAQAAHRAARVDRVLVSDMADFWARIEVPVTIEIRP